MYRLSTIVLLAPRFWKGMINFKLLRARWIYPQVFESSCLSIFWGEFNLGFPFYLILEIQRKAEQILYVVSIIYSFILLFQKCLWSAFYWLCAILGVRDNKLYYLFDISKTIPTKSSVFMWPSGDNKYFKWWCLRGETRRKERELCIFWSRVF